MLFPLHGKDGLRFSRLRATRVHFPTKHIKTKLILWISLKIMAIFSNGRSVKANVHRTVGKRFVQVTRNGPPEARTPLQGGTATGGRFSMRGNDLKICSMSRILLVPILLGMLFGCGTANVQHRAALDQVPPAEVAPEEPAPDMSRHGQVVREFVPRDDDAREEVDSTEISREEQPESEGELPEQPRQVERRLPSGPDMSWTVRVVTDEELDAISRKNPAISVLTAWEILARLNTIARYYIPEAIRHRETPEGTQRFQRLQRLEPLCRAISPDLAGTEKFILIVKDHPFLGLVFKRAADGRHADLRREEVRLDEGGNLCGKGKGRNPRFPELSERLRAALPHAVGPQDL